MTPLVSAVNQIVSIMTIIGQAIIVSFFISLLVYKKGANVVQGIIGRYAVFFAFIIALIAISGSLFFSEIAGFEPCKLCWFQRILMYPLVILFAVALWKKDGNIFRYAIPLSCIGMVIAVYHYYIQVREIASVVCVPGSPESCASNPFMSFGYISIPMMSLTAFLLIALIGINKIINDKKI